MKFTRKERDDPRLQMTGLVDVLFLLIIFFTVTTTFATTGGIDVNLPEASSQRPLEKVEKLFVVINKDGEAFIEGEKVSDRKLRTRFAGLAKTDADAIVILQADRETLHGRVVAIMDMAQNAGLKRLAIAAEQKPGEAAPETPPEPEPEKPSFEEKFPP